VDFQNELERLKEEIKKLKKENERLEEENKNLRQMIQVDFLTGLYNKYMVGKRLEEVLAFVTRGRNEEPVSLLFLDLDYFKTINDSFGHEAGDRVLKEMGKILNQEKRQYDIVGRWGGEEFIVILPRTNLEMAKGVAERIKKRIASLEFHFQTKSNPVKITVSIGVAQWKLGEKVFEFIRRADLAMYKAKRLGRNRVEIAE
jgi:diguanylate cyclase (GGDEF)-like protein